MANTKDKVLTQEMNLRISQEMFFRLQIAANREGKPLRPFIRDVLGARLEGMNIPKVSSEEELERFNKAEAEASEKREIEARLQALQREMEVLGAKLAS